jgi:hypothetical protein
MGAWGVLGGLLGIEGDKGAVDDAATAVEELESFDAAGAGETSAAAAGAWVGADESEDVTELELEPARGSSPSFNVFGGACPAAPRPAPPAVPPAVPVAPPATPPTTPAGL